MKYRLHKGPLCYHIKVKEQARDRWIATIRFMDGETITVGPRNTPQKAMRALIETQEEDDWLA